MSFLILIRHGQSVWNLENKFTGWVDVDLSEKGEFEAKKAGEMIKSENIKIDYYYSSLQIRANRTLEIIQKTIKNEKKFIKAWELNERHYGALTGLDKTEMSEKLGKDQIHQFRRSWDMRPEALSKKSPYHPINIDTYKNMSKEMIPSTESLKDTYERVIKFYKNEIENKIKNYNILISAHGNSIRALCKYLFKLDEIQISKLEIPTGNPLIIEMSKKLEIKSCKYLDTERSKNLLVF